MGGGPTFTPKSQIRGVVLRYGYGFNAIRNGEEASQSIGLLFQYDLEARKKFKHKQSD